MSAPQHPNSSKTRRQARFSVLSTLFITAAVAITLTISAPQPQDENDQFLVALFGEVYEPHIEWQYGLAAIASFGSGVALWMQSNQLATKPGFRAACWLRRIVTMGLAGCLAWRLLLQRGVVSDLTRDDISPLPHSSVFPDPLWYLLLIIALRLQLIRRPPGLAPGRLPSMLFAVAAFGSCCILVALVAGEMSYITFLVHVATNGIDAACDPRFNRTGVFPHHPSEGFFTYWTALLAAVCSTATLAAACGACLVKSRTAWMVCGLVVLVGAGLQIGYLTWFYASEFPRVSPDMASVPPPITTSELLLAIITLVVFVSWLALALTTPLRGAQPTCRLRFSGALGSLPAWLGALGAALLGLISTAESTITNVQTTFAFNRFMGTASRFWSTLWGSFRYLLLSPNWLLMLAVACCGASLAWQLWRGRAIRVARIEGRGLARRATLLFFAGIVGLPTMAVYGFCCWLGPWWQ